MNEPIILKDTDTTVEITIKDDAGTPIDLTGIAGIVVKVFQKDKDIDKFSLQPQTGYRSLTIKDAVNGIIEIYLNADNMKVGDVDEWLFYEVKTQAVNVNFDGGTEEKSSGIIRLAILKDTELQDVNFQ